jgi:hypothetical protein
VRKHDSDYEHAYRFKYQLSHESDCSVHYGLRGWVVSTDAIRVRF